ncbi:hypothetical protein CPB86DRAFT_811387 [Serendipita vermifera]|nr:hypothetical protein CPB86DRAFT_811387 [Serendipita vermifera]
MEPSAWLSADKNGRIKLITCQKTPKEEKDIKNPALKYTLTANSVEPSSSKSVQKLAVGTHAGHDMVAIACADGSTSLCGTDKLIQAQFAPQWNWDEPPQRFNTNKKTGDVWVGLDLNPLGIIQCTGHGKARITSINSENAPDTHTCAVPMNIRHLKGSASGKHFAYAGREVNLSVWDTERAFQTPITAESAPTQKRPRAADQLFPGEIWRAKNVENDSLDLRQSINISSLAFLSGFEARHDIAIGNSVGCVYRYDTRKGRKAVSSWSNKRMSGGISIVEKGLREHELFIADCETKLWVIDLRKSKEALYAYKGLSGKATAISASHSTGFAAAGSLDQYFRLLSSPSPGQDISSNSGQVVGKLYITVAPSAIVPLATNEATSGIDETERNEEGDSDREWEGLQQVSDEDDEESKRVSKKRRKKI